MVSLTMVYDLSLTYSYENFYVHYVSYSTTACNFDIIMSDVAS